MARRRGTMRGRMILVIGAELFADLGLYNHAIRRRSAHTEPECEPAPPPAVLPSTAEVEITSVIRIGSKIRLETQSSLRGRSFTWPFRSNRR